MAGTVITRVNIFADGSTRAAFVNGMPCDFAVSRKKSPMASIDRMRPCPTILSGVSTTTAFLSSPDTQYSILTLSSPMSMPTIFLTSRPRFLL